MLVRIIQFEENGSFRLFYEGDAKASSLNEIYYELSKQAHYRLKSYLPFKNGRAFTSSPITSITKKNNLVEFTVESKRRYQVIEH